MKNLLWVILVVLLTIRCSEEGDDPVVFSVIEVIPDQNDEDDCWDTSETWDFDLNLTNVEESDVDFEAFVTDFTTMFPISPDGKLTPLSDVPATYIIVASLKDDFTVADTLVMETTFCTCDFDMACDQFSDAGTEVTITPIADTDLVFFNFTQDGSSNNGTIAFPLKYLPSQGGSTTITLTQEDAISNEPWTLVYNNGATEFLNAPSDEENGIPTPGSSSLRIQITNHGKDVSGSLDGECMYTSVVTGVPIMTSFRFEFTGGIFDPSIDAYGCE